MNNEIVPELEPLKSRFAPGSSKTLGPRVRPPKGQRRYAILRVKKIKTAGDLAAAARHNFRERDADNADPNRKDSNQVLLGATGSEEIAELWNARAPEKVRKNAVRALEYVVTASPEAMERIGAESSKAYLEQALDWLKERHGEENILSAVIHDDETTPHLQALVIPIDHRGRLNARGLIGGKGQLSAMQTEFATQVGAHFGLERGLERSGATHQSIKKYYAQLAALDQISVELPERSVGAGSDLPEKDEDWRERASAEASETLRQTIAVSLVERGEMSRDIDYLQTQLTDARKEVQASREIADRSSLGVAALCALDGILRSPKEDQKGLIDRFVSETKRSWGKLPDAAKETIQTSLVQDFSLEPLDLGNNRRRNRETDLDL